MAQADATEIRGTAEVIDADIIKIGNQRVILWGIDAPERCQSGGAQAAAALAARVLNQRVEATRRATDDFQRTVATVRLDGEDIGAWLVLQGHAWARGYRHAPGPYAWQETAARAARRGVFADPRAQDPREFRRQHGRCE